eukprot:UN14852
MSLKYLFLNNNNLDHMPTIITAEFGSTMNFQTPKIHKFLTLWKAYSGKYDLTTARGFSPEKHPITVPPGENLEKKDRTVYWSFAN